MSASEFEAMIDAGLVRCDSCGFWNNPCRMLFNADGSKWFCATVADGETPCADEERPCVDCCQPTGVRELDMDGTCGCIEEAAAWLDRVQAMGAHQIARAA